MTKKYMTLPAMVAGALGVSAAAGSVAWGAEPTTDELRQQIEQLQAKVQQLETMARSGDLAKAGPTCQALTLKLAELTPALQHLVRPAGPARAAA